MTSRYNYGDGRKVIQNVIDKKEIIELFNGLSERADYVDIMAEIYFKQKVDKSLRQIEKER